MPTELPPRLRDAVMLPSLASPRPHKKFAALVLECTDAACQSKLHVLFAHDRRDLTLGLV
eukprot:4532246-Amphidinium_carterae.1